MTYSAFIVLIIAGQRIVAPDMRGPYETLEVCEARLEEGRVMVESRPDTRYLDGICLPAGVQLS